MKGKALSFVQEVAQRAHEVNTMPRYRRRWDETVCSATFLQYETWN